MTYLETELKIHGTENTDALKEMHPGIALYRREKDGSFAVDHSRYFSPDAISRFYVDKAYAVVADLIVNTEKRVLAEQKMPVRHDLVTGGSAQVGVLQQRKVIDAHDITKRGYARILFQRKEGGAVEEAYILCDLSRSSGFGSQRLEEKLEPDENAPFDVRELMAKPGYLDRTCVHVMRK